MLKIKSKRQGAELTSILKDENEMLFDGKTFWNRQSPILFPIVGQIKEGKTQIEEKIYEMSQHGFARDMEFQEIEENHYILKYNEQTLKKYPYKFELHVIYKIVGDALQVSYEVKNIDNKKIPSTEFLKLSYVSVGKPAIRSVFIFVKPHFLARAKASKNCCTVCFQIGRAHV